MKDHAVKAGRGQVPGIRVLISAGALVTTLSGWAILGIKDARAAVGYGAAAGGGEIPPELVALIEPLPTVVPPPADLTFAAPAVQPTPIRQILRSVSRPAPPAPEPDAVSRSSS